MLEELTKSDVHSDEYINKLNAMFGYGDNALLGMRESETLVEVFDRVSKPVLRFNSPPKFIMISGSEFFAYGW